jgi:putative serine protease PepD
MDWGSPPSTAARRSAESSADPYWPQPPPPVPDPPPAPAGGSAGGLRWITAAVAGAVVAVLVAVPLTLRLQPAPEPVRFETEPSPVTAVADAVLPTVARVDVLTAGGQTGSGSAVIFRPDGYLLTNAHVVEQAVETVVTLPDGTSQDAEVVGADTRSDLAVLEIPTNRQLPVPAFAEELPRIGDTAIAIGSPFGLEGSVTVGVVSALHRTIPGPGGIPLVDLLQTDASAGQSPWEAAASPVAKLVFSFTPVHPIHHPLGPF